MSFLINVFDSATLERHRDYRHDVIAAKVAVPKINHHRHQTPQQKGIIYRSLFLHAIQKRLVDSKQKFIVRNCKFMPSYWECLVFSPASLCFPERPIHFRLQFKIKALIMVRVARFHAFAYRLMFYINFAAISVFIRSECISGKLLLKKKIAFFKTWLVLVLPSGKSHSEAAKLHSSTFLSSSLSLIKFALEVPATEDCYDDIKSPTQASLKAHYLRF